MKKIILLAMCLVLLATVVSAKDKWVLKLTEQCEMYNFYPNVTYFPPVDTKEQCLDEGNFYGGSMKKSADPSCIITIECLPLEFVIQHYPEYKWKDK